MLLLCLDSPAMVKLVLRKKLAKNGT